MIRRITLLTNHHHNFPQTSLFFLPPIAQQSCRFARSRPAPPLVTSTGSSNNQSSSQLEDSFEDDDLLMMGLKPLAEQSQSSNSNSITEASSKNKNNSSNTSSYAAKSSFSKFFQSSVEDAKKKTKQQHNKMSSNNLFQDLMSDLKTIQADPQQVSSSTTHEDNQQQSRTNTNNKKNKYDPVYTTVMRDIASRSRHLESLAPELERFQRNRSFLIRKWAKQDVADVVRRQGRIGGTSSTTDSKDNVIDQDKESEVSSPSTKMLDLLDSSSPTVVRDRVRNMVVAEVDPLEAKAREEACLEFQEAVKERARKLYLEDHQKNNTTDEDDITEQDYYEEAVFDLIEQMSDKELQVIFKSGALDLEALWEGSPELSQLPNEYLQNEGVLQLTRELADLARPQLPNDDEAHALVSADKDDREEFFQNRKNLKTLESFERRSSYTYVEQPNLVLQNLAQKDEKIKSSLERMDRAKRELLRDDEFQAALAYVQQLEQQEVQEANVRPKMRKSAAEVAVPFFDEGHSRPPKKAMSVLPAPAPKGAAKNDPSVKKRSLKSELAKQSRDMFNRREQGQQGQQQQQLRQGQADSSLNQWYD